MENLLINPGIGKPGSLDFGLRKSKSLFPNDFIPYEFVLYFSIPFHNFFYANHFLSIIN